ncbi:hypothetical protein LTR56_025202 [Elasticomyces elasticus]|nr:hypothetical protein LTR56_025202 [Elasticomyces elasticus]KAK3649267.1 hypothetical protein LTR22_012996 [Elasticomyces elasticus]KAK4928199.1 hypothetical protein LTR49_005137 [Elasticomyces elasticus]KAK5765953.1 hypothetical protein LTS12_003960 [Elasticomyces elasticus]
MRDAEMADLGGLPPYEPVAKTPAARPVIVTLRRAANKHTEPDFERCDAIKIDSTTEFHALYDAFIARVHRQYSGEETDVLNGRCNMKLEDGRSIKFNHTDTWEACRDILLTQDKSELSFTFWIQEVIKQEGAIQKANDTRAGAEVPASKPESAHAILAEDSDQKSPKAFDAEKPKSVQVTIKKYKPHVRLPGTDDSLMATKGGCIEITSTTSHRDVTLALITQAGLKLGTPNLNIADSSFKSYIKLTPWSSDGQNVYVRDEYSWATCRYILLKDYNSLYESVNPKLTFEFTVEGESGGTSCVVQ